MILPSPIEIGPYIRVGVYTLDEVLSHVVISDDLFKRGVKKKSPEFKELTEYDFDGHMVKMTSQRYELFSKKGTVCSCCGVVGEYFGLEKNKGQEGNRYHFNLYGQKDGVEVLITKDHIIPKSKGGSNILDNYQVMCFDCNIEKGDNL